MMCLIWLNNNFVYENCISRDITGSSCWGRMHIGRLMSEYNRSWNSSNQSAVLCGTCTCISDFRSKTNAIVDKPCEEHSSDRVWSGVGFWKPPFVRGTPSSREAKGCFLTNNIAILTWPTSWDVAKYVESLMTIHTASQNIHFEAWFWCPQNELSWRHAVF